VTFGRVLESRVSSFFSLTSQESPPFAIGLWEEVEKWLLSRGKEARLPMFSRDDGTWDLSFFYTNFEVGVFD